MRRSQDRPIAAEYNRQLAALRRVTNVDDADIRVAEHRSIFGKQTNFNISRP
jgi:hypothetical protein